MTKVLLDYVYKDSILSKTSKNPEKIVKKKFIIDFYQKQSDQQLFERMQQDLKLLSLFRENYKEEIL
jgi:hypothetical protein